MTDFSAFEEVDAVRMSWNVWPNSKLEATKCVIPYAAVYTPNKRLANMPVLQYEPIPCKQCGAMLNPYSRVDFYSKLWVCPFCHSRNHFPGHYQGITEQNLPAELYPQYCTVEYRLRSTVPIVPPVYLFVIDTCIAEDELAACKAAVLQALQLIPEYASVGLVTYGTHVHVHELGFTECSKAYVFRGSKEHTSQHVVEQLGLSRASQRPGQPGQAPTPTAANRRFLLPLGECEFTINNVLEELQKDAYPVVSTQRPARCTGAALQVAEALLSASIPTGICAARIMLFVGGPCTEGAGKVVSQDLTEEIRSHKDLAKDAAPHFRKAKKFYDGLAAEFVQHGHALDIFACALDQVGFAEMKDIVQSTGGMSVQTDTFLNVVFKDSLKRLFARPEEDVFLGVSSNGVFEVIPSRDVKVAGLLGCAARMDKKSALVADTETGLGGTTQWKLCALDYDTSLALFFEITASAKDQQDAAVAGAAGQQLYLQFITRYLHFSGELRCRVTTVSRRWAEGGRVEEVVAGFDQEAAAVVMGRLATHKMEVEEDFDATRWLDRALIRLAARFGEYRKDDSTSFSLRSELSFYPQFMFNLRRSQFVQVFGNSPDETAYCRLLLFHVAVPDAMVMIQPQLTAYHLGGPPEPVLLDVTSILPERILLLDAYFYVVIFHGTTIAQWRKAEYHLQPEHVVFAQLLQAPQVEAKEICKRRFPVPRLVDCDQNGSQARFLLTKLNPSATYQTSSNFSSEVIMTDDVSLSVFTDHLKRLAVQS